LDEYELQMLYTEQIIDRYKNPRNFGKLIDFTIEGEDANELCGDRIKMQLKIDGNKIVDVKFKGEGCSISLASADLLCDYVKEKDLNELKKIDKNDVLKILGIELTPVRLKCALLPLKVLKLAYLNLSR